jgi:Zn-dependent protease with chaperone function
VHATQPCPRCNAELPVNQGFVTWCDRCGWNVTAPSVLRPPQTRFDRLYAAAGRRLGDRLEDELLAAERLDPRVTPARAAAYAIAVVTTLLTVALAAGGVLLVVLAFPNPAAIVVGPVLVGLAWLMRPRLGKPPTDDVVTRADAPALHSLVDEIADALDVPHVDIIVVDHAFNASWTILGARRRSVLTLGFPLLRMLEPQQRVALIAHELAHGRNGDSTRGLVVGSSVRALAAFYWSIAPEHFDGASAWSELAFFDRIVNVVLWIVSRPALALLQLQLHLLLRDSQRAEYLADALAARIAGTAATVGLHERLLLESMLNSTVQRAMHARRNGADLFDELDAVLQRVPERELERRRRAARLEDARLEATHPPTVKRIDLLERREPLEPRVVCDPARDERIAIELKPRESALAAALIEDYRDSLYAR